MGISELKSCGMRLGRIERDFLMKWKNCLVNCRIRVTLLVEEEDLILEKGRRYSETKE